MNTGKQEINCSVNTCKYNDKANYCTLSNITVGNNNTANAQSKTQTECDSFQMQ